MLTNYRLLHSFLLLLCFSLFGSMALPAQDKPLTILKKTKTYKRLVATDSLQKMVELKSLMPAIQYDLRYATENNFTGTVLYPIGTYTFLRLEPARALAKLEEALKPEGLGLKIFDAYRPYAATVKMWDLIQDERYVANPAKGSGHNRGLAVDLTLIHLSTGEELDMGTGFDHFSDTAHHGFAGLSPTVIANREKLKTLMESYGFRALPTEWWHYSWPNDGRYAVMDLPFTRLLSSYPPKPTR